jgi:hypothetical protein
LSGSAGQDLSLKPIYRTALAFAGSALASLAFPGLLFVDGAPRCLTVYQHPALQFHPNHHLLYLVNILAWTRLVTDLGFKLQEPLQFILAVDTMNWLAAAGCFAILFWIILRVTSPWKTDNRCLSRVWRATVFLA